MSAIRNSRGTHVDLIDRQIAPRDANSVLPR